MRTLQEIQQSTYNEMCDCLNRYGMCCVERPTGFGKTKLFMDYARNHPTQKHLYIYDVNSVVADITKKYAPQNVVFLSYAAISRKKAAQDVMKLICSYPWGSLMFDEAHLLGGENIQQLILDIIPLAVAAGVKVIGGTATKMRTDLVDVSKRFFSGHGVSEYTILDAIDDKIMLEPVWAVTAHYRELLKSAHKQVGSGGNSYVKNMLSQLDRAYATIDGVSSVYRDTVQMVYNSVPDIMRFIIFYPTVQSIKDNMFRDVSEFKKAFPAHQIAHVALSTDSSHLSTVTEVEEAFTMDGRQVQLIFAVNMLNQSYHSDLLTGIVMYRSTYSNIIFTQELGRIMSVTSKFPGIVFDNVGNVFVKPDRAMAWLQVEVQDWTKTPSGTSIPKSHCNIKLRATQELIRFQEVYQRIMATREITQEQVDYAKYITDKVGAPIELVMQGLNLPKDIAERLVHDD